MPRGIYKRTKVKITKAPAPPDAIALALIALQTKREHINAAIAHVEALNAPSNLIRLDTAR